MVRSLAGDRSIVIKKVNKGSCVVIWDRNDYLLEAEKQLKDKKVYIHFKCNNNILPDLVEKSKTMIFNQNREGIINEKELRHYLYEYKKATNSRKLNLFSQRLNFSIIILSQSCKMDYPISKILVTF